MSAVRRPSRGLTRLAGDLVGRRRSVSWSALYDLRRSLDGKRRSRWEGFCRDIESAAGAAGSNDVRALTSALIHDVGLDRAAAALDAGRTRADRSGQSDDLRALERVATIHPELSDFESWLRTVTGVRDEPDGVLLTTVHRVKGLEWKKVIVYGAETGLMPHDLASDREEERRVFHVAMTRAIDDVVIVVDKSRVSRFVLEAEGTAPVIEEPSPARTADSRPQRGGVSVAIGTRVGLPGGFGGVVERHLPIGVLVALEPGPGRVSVKWGEHITTSEGSGPLRPGAVGADVALVETLKRWRLDTARAQNVPAFVVLNDASLEELARRRPQTEGELLDVRGIGPAKLEAYGDDLLALLAE
jgi:DNA helicase-2/ATP-dependent DNA helicase PcrA